MARRRSRRRQQHDQAPGWVWMLGGLALGLLIAGGLYVWGGDEAPAPAPSVASRTAAPAAARDATPQARPAAQPRETETAASEPPRGSRFEFYDILPQFEVVIPEVESTPRPDNQPVAVADPGSYVLQAGSFRSHADADRMQASLALLGIESRIQTVTIDQDVFHRVRIGPVSDLDDLNRIRRQLQDARVEVLLMRVPE